MRRFWFFLMLAVIGPTGAQTPGKLKAFLREYLEIASGPPDWKTYYKAVQVDLDNDGAKEIIVYVAGRGWCGSGGCVLLILRPNGSSFCVVGRTTITNPPITVLPALYNGWHSIAVLVRGGGVPGYEAELRFDGKAYPSNPSVPPARPLPSGSSGDIVIPDEEEMSTL